MKLLCIQFHPASPGQIPHERLDKVLHDNRGRKARPAIPFFAHRADDVSGKGA
jgi:hypothetical protein